MRIEADYVKALLEVFLNAETTTVNLDDFPMLDYSDAETPEQEKEQRRFVFHMEILEDGAFIETTNDTSGSIVVQRLSGDQYTWQRIPLRLTATGHDFAAALTKPGIFEKLRDEFADEGPGAFAKAAIALGVKMAEKKLRNLIGDEDGAAE